MRPTTRTGTRAGRIRHARSSSGQTSRPPRRSGSWAPTPGSSTTCDDLAAPLLIGASTPAPPAPSGCITSTPTPSAAASGTISAANRGARLPKRPGTEQDASHEESQAASVSTRLALVVARRRPCYALETRGRAGRGRFQPLAPSSLPLLRLEAIAAAMVPLGAPPPATVVLHDDQQLVLGHAVVAARAYVRGKRCGGAALPRQGILVQFPFVARHSRASSMRKSVCAKIVPAGSLTVPGHVERAL